MSEQKRWRDGLSPPSLTSRDLGSHALFFQRLHKHCRRHLRVRVRHILATNRVHVPRHPVSRVVVRAKRHSVRELHSARLGRVVVDGALLHADKDDDECRIGTLRRHDHSEIERLGQNSSNIGAHRGKQQDCIHDGEKWLGKNAERSYQV